MTETRIHPLQQARKKLRLKQKVLADLTGLSEPTIKRAERGEPLEDFTISAICKYFSLRYGRQVDQHELGLRAKWETQHKNMLLPVHTTILKEERVFVPTMHEKYINDSDGCFSFGKIKTTGIVLDGDGTGMYLPQHIRSHYIPVAEELPEELHKKLFPVVFTPQEICSFVFSRDNWTPGGLICLYHALVHEFGRREVDKIIASYI